MATQEIARYLLARGDNDGQKLIDYAIQLIQIDDEQDTTRECYMYNLNLINTNYSDIKTKYRDFDIDDVPLVHLIRETQLRTIRETQKRTAARISELKRLQESILQKIKRIASTTHCRASLSCTIQGYVVDFTTGCIIGANNYF